jgi:hypothetical protein
VNLLFLVIFLIPSIIFAQNKTLFVDGQFHRDFHRQIFTSTIEIFNLDPTGSTFFFTDFDFDSAGQVDAYFEISHNFAVTRFQNGTGNLSLQYNDGVMAADVNGKIIPRTVLYGVSLSDLQVGPVNFEVQALARQEFGVALGWQLTGIWNWQIKGTPFEFLGYVDWNSQKTGHQPDAIQTEPQIMWRWHQLGLGSEVEISRNFTGAWTKKHGFHYHEWYVHPTVFLRIDL